MTANEGFAAPLLMQAFLLTQTSDHMEYTAPDIVCWADKAQLESKVWRCQLQVLPAVKRATQRQ